MQTMKEVFGREEEHHNLRRIGLCYMVVIALVVLAFGVTYLSFPAREPSSEAPVSTAVLEDD